MKLTGLSRTEGCHVDVRRSGFWNMKTCYHPLWGYGKEITESACLEETDSCTWVEWFQICATGKTTWLREEQEAAEWAKHQSISSRGSGPHSDCEASWLSRRERRLLCHLVFVLFQPTLRQDEGKQSKGHSEMAGLRHLEFVLRKQPCAKNDQNNSEDICSALCSAGMHHLIYVLCMPTWRHEIKDETHKTCELLVLRRSASSGLRHLMYAR